LPAIQIYGDSDAAKAVSNRCGFMQKTLRKGRFSLGKETFFVRGCEAIMLMVKELSAICTKCSAAFYFLYFPEPNSAAAAKAGSNSERPSGNHAKRRQVRR
jgi:hypothetical protein